MSVDPASLVERYYRALDEHAYDDLEDVLAPAFTQRRPDRTFESREAFVRFMREERPGRDTTHELDEELLIDRHEPDEDGARIVLARGRVLTPGGSTLVDFADVFAVAAGRIERLDTYTR